VTLPAAQELARVLAAASAPVVEDDVTIPQQDFDAITASVAKNKGRSSAGLLS